MAFELKEGYISIFKNEMTKENQPLYTGEGLLKGETVKIALWVKEGKKGKFFSGKIEVKEQKPPNNDAEKESEDVPF